MSDIIYPVHIFRVSLLDISSDSLPLKPFPIQKKTAPNQMEVSRAAKGSFAI